MRSMTWLHAIPKGLAHHASGYHGGGAQCRAVQWRSVKLWAQGHGSPARSVGEHLQRPIRPLHSTRPELRGILKSVLRYRGTMAGTGPPAIVSMWRQALRGHKSPRKARRAGTPLEAEPGTVGRPGRESGDVVPPVLWCPLTRETEPIQLVRYRGESGRRKAGVESGTENCIHLVRPEGRMSR